MKCALTKRRGVRIARDAKNQNGLSTTELTFRALATDEGLTLETSALKLFTVSSLRYQLS